jgi:hypothetical protein
VRNDSPLHILWLVEDFWIFLTTWNTCDPGDEDFEVNTSRLTKRVKQLASVLSHFRKRWRLEYLNELRQRHCYSEKTSPRSSVSKGDVVSVHDDALPRGLWKLWRIQKVLTGSQKQPQAALGELLPEITSMSFWEGRYTCSIHWRYMKLKCQKLTMKQHLPPVQRSTCQLRLASMMLPLERSQSELQLRELWRKWALGPKCYNRKVNYNVVLCIEYTVNNRSLS